MCVLDFEATCWDRSKEHEIIEFPSVLLEWSPGSKSVTTISEIQIFIKPSRRPVVSEFCHNLTGITQEQVNGGVSLKEALKTHLEWLKEHCNNSTENVIIVTCGHWDLQTMLPMDLGLNHLRYPDPVYKSWVNIKQAFTAALKPFRVRSMPQMLKHLKLEMIGRHHSGIDDSKNIARIFGKLVELGLTQDQFIGLLNVI